MGAVGPASRRTTEPAATGGRSTGRGARGGRTGHAPVPDGVLRRARLDALVDAAVQHPVAVVAAGAGWGKTTAVALWAASRTSPTAWLTLAARDDTPAAFWYGVVHALRDSGAVPRQHALHRVQVPPAVTDAFVTRTLQILDTLPAPVLLVVDDFHHVHHPGVLAAVEDLARYPRRLHLVLVGRTDPPLALRRLTLEGRVDHVRARHLAFDATEVQDLAELDGVRLRPDVAAALLTRTEGWPVGVRLGLQRHAGPDGATLTELLDSDRAAAEYLAEEVLARQEPAVREFLLRTSVATPLTVDLAEALVPHAPAQRYLEERVAAHDFVTATGAPPAEYRYHPMLQETLRGTLRFEDPDAYRDAHARAAHWLMRHGEPMRALEHASAVGSWDLFGQVFVESAAMLLPGPQRQAVLTAARGAAPEHDPTSVWCVLYAAAVAGVEGRTPACEDHLAHARTLLDGLAEEHHAPAAVLTEVLDAHAARSRGDVLRTASAARAAHRLLSRAPWPFPAFDAYRTWAHELHATGLFWAGRLGAARAELERILHEGANAVSLTTLNAHAYLALCDAVQGRYEDAAVRATSTLGQAEDSGWSTYEQLRPAYAAAALVGLARGDTRGAERALAYGWAADVGDVEPVLDVALHAVTAQTAAVAGRRRTALAAVRDAVRAADGFTLPTVAADLVARAVTDLRVRAAVDDEAFDLGHVPGTPSPEVRLVCRARVELARHLVPAAAEHVSDVLEDDADLDVLTRVEALLVAAGVAEAEHDSARASALTREAFAEAAPAGLVLPFLRAAPAVSRAPVERVVRDRHDVVAVRLRALLDPREVRDEPVPLVSPLTDRELVILTALATMRSNAEIGDELFVTVNTVKAHLKSLFRKLEVGTRRAAVQRGRELGLLP